MANDNKTRDELEAMDEDELKALANARGITVTASDGSGQPSVDDYVEALATPEEPFGGDEAADPIVAKADKRAQAAQQAAGKPAKKLSETVPGGRYVDRNGTVINAEGQPIDDDNKVIEEKDRKVPESAE